MRRPTIAETFDQHWKEDENGCLIWQRAVGSHGYGVFSLHGKLELAHRYAYEREYGALPEKRYSCHKCDVRLCVKPAHLFPGTCKDNMQDALRKGKGKRGVHRGEDNATSKLTEKQVRRIRHRVAAGETQVAVAKSYGLHKTNVQCIVNRKTWKHLA